MFGLSEFKKQILGSIRQLENQIADLKRSEQELKTQNARLHMLLKGLGRKIVCRMPVSLESLEKSLTYDLIFADEVEGWKRATHGGTVLDIRSSAEFSRGALAGAVNIPLDQISMRIETYPKDTAFLLICENGVRSASASELLQAKGYVFTYVLKGGMNAVQQIHQSGLSRESTSTAVAV